MSQPPTFRAMLPVVRTMATPTTSDVGGAGRLGRDASGPGGWLDVQLRDRRGFAGAYFGGSISRVVPAGVQRMQRLLLPDQYWRLYQTTPDVRACVDSIARRVSTWDWEVAVELDAKDTRYEEAMSVATAATRWLAAPDKDGTTWQEFLTMVATDLLIYDASGIELVEDADKRLSELVALRGSTIYPVVNEHGKVLKYVQDPVGFGLNDPSSYGWTEQGQSMTIDVANTYSTVTFTKEALVYMRLHPNTYGTLGLPILESLVNECVALLLSSDHTVLAFDADEVPPGILVVGGIGDLAASRARADLERLRGKDHKIRLIHSEVPGGVDAKWVELRRTPKELAMAETVDAMRRTIWRVFGVMPVEMGATQDVPRAVGEVQVDVGRSHLLEPLLELIEAKINARILPRLVPPGMVGALQFRFDREAKSTPQERQARTDANTKLLDRGVLTVNEVRLMEGLQPFGPEGDVPMVTTPAGPMPLASIVPKPEEPAPPTPPAAPEGGGGGSGSAPPAPTAPSSPEVAAGEQGVSDVEAGVSSGSEEAAPGEAQTVKPAAVEQSRRPRVARTRSGVAARDGMEGDACPVATQDVATNLENRQHALDVAAYGPADPTNPGDYWEKKAEKMHTDAETAKGMKCANCAFFNLSPKMLACIGKGIGDDAEQVINAGRLGFCEAFDFKCASERTCDAWVTGGPITEDEVTEEPAVEQEASARAIVDDTGRAKDDEPTNFPKAGDDQKVSLNNSGWALFDPDYAERLRVEYPEVWSRGGNVLGNTQYRRLRPVVARGGVPETETEDKAVRLREAWGARHFQDFRLPGVVAQIKWFVVGKLGEADMKALVNEAKAKADEHRAMHAKAHGKGCECHRARAKMPTADDLPSEWQETSALRNAPTLDLVALGAQVADYRATVLPVYADTAAELDRVTRARLKGKRTSDSVEGWRAECNRVLDGLVSVWSSSTTSLYRQAAREGSRAVAKVASGYEVDADLVTAAADAFRDEAMGFLAAQPGLVWRLRAIVDEIAAGLLSSPEVARAREVGQEFADLLADDGDWVPPEYEGLSYSQLVASVSSASEVGFVSDVLMVGMESQAYRVDNWSGKLVELANRVFVDGLQEQANAENANPFREPGTPPAQWYGEWVAVGDNRTCQVCRSLGAKGIVPLSTIPTVPGSPSTQCGARCRCVIVTWSAAQVASGEAVSYSGAVPGATPL
jgi:hypothetical protein